MKYMYADSKKGTFLTSLIKKQQTCSRRIIVITSVNKSSFIKNTQCNYNCLLQYYVMKGRNFKSIFGSSWCEIHIDMILKSQKP